MPSNLIPIPFDFESHPVRALDHNGEVWFVAVDVSSALSIENVSRALSRLEEDEKGLHSVKTPGGVQEVNVISEPGLYRLTMTSRKKAAKRFTRWVTHEVLPKIRKTGRYDQEGTPSRHGGLTTEQQNTIKDLVQFRVEELPFDKRARAALTCWSALKNEFQKLTYTDIPSSQFTEAIALVARLPLDDEQPQPHEANTNHLFTNLKAISVHLDVIAEYWEQEIGPSIRHLNPRLHGIFNGHVMHTRLRNRELMQQLQ